MGERSIARVGAAAGLVCVVLSLLAGFIYPQQPRIDSPASTTLQWVTGNRVALQTGMTLGLFAAGAFLWFVGYLRTALVADAGGGESLAPVVFSTGIATGVLSALGVLPPALLAFMAAQPAGVPDATTVRMLGDLNLVLFAVTSLVTGVFLLALGLAVLRRNLTVPAWLGWLSLAAAALNAVTVWIAMTFSSYHGTAWTGVAFSAFIGYLVVVSVTSVTLLRRAGTRAAPRPAAVTP